MKLNKNIKIFINYFFGPLLFVWLSYSIYKEIKNQPDLQVKWMQIRESLNGPMVWYLAAVIFFMLVNWGIEAVKWKIAVQKVQNVNFIKAFKGVLSGVSFSVTTPNGVGEYFGRIFYMDEGNRLKAISITIVCSISQLIITMLIGLIGLLILLPEIEASGMIASPWTNVICYGVLAALVILLFFYFRLSWLVKLLERLPGSKRYIYLVKALEEFNTSLLLKLLSLSALRFTVFMVQYYLMFRLFNVDVSWWQGFWVVSVSFLVMAAIPTIALIELAQRGKVVTILVGLFSTNVLGIGLATACIWVINLIVPAIAGSLLILSIKRIFRNKNGNEGEVNS